MYIHKHIHKMAHRNIYSIYNSNLGCDWALSDSYDHIDRVGQGTNSPRVFSLQYECAMKVSNNLEALSKTPTILNLCTGRNKSVRMSITSFRSSPGRLVKPFSGHSVSSL